MFENVSETAPMSDSGRIEVGALVNKVNVFCG